VSVPAATVDAPIATVFRVRGRFDEPHRVIAAALEFEFVLPARVVAGDSVAFLPPRGRDM
jgi:hypothetical protein